MAPVRKGSVTDDSEEEEESDVEDEREPSEPFAFKIHYADSTSPAVWSHYASECTVIVLI